MSKSIIQLVDDLPENNITVMALRALDFVVPGEWDNTIGFDNTVEKVTGETDPAVIQDIRERAVYLYHHSEEGYERAMWLYKTVDTADTALGAAALANKVSQKIGFLSFLDRLTPKADTAQSIDLAIKLVVEIVAYCQINGIPGDSIGDFVNSLVEEYGGPSLMRMAALICFDGLLPLGPDFILKVGETISGLNASSLESNPVFSRIGSMIPGGSSTGQLGFIGDSFSAVRGWMGDFVESKGINPQNVLSSLQNFVEIADDKLDYVGAFLDMTTNYFEHTGTQTLTRSLIDRAYAEI